MYRKVALERLSSPEQLDQLLQVTTPKGWLALIAILVLLAFVILWGFFGTLPGEVYGEGILSAQAHTVVANGEGLLEEVRVGVGDRVEAGDVIAVIRQDALVRRIADAQSRLDAHGITHRNLESYMADQERLEARELAQRRQTLDQTVATEREAVKLLKDRVETEQELIEQGISAKAELIEYQQQLNAAEGRLARSQLQLGGLEREYLQAKQEREQELAESRDELSELERQLEDLRAARRETSEILTPHSGRIFEKTSNPGDLMDPGTPVVKLEMDSEELTATLYVPATQGKQILAEMSARVVPSTVQREEYGFILGKVLSVADFPSSRQGMLSQLANQELVDKLMAQGPPIQVDIQLERDDSTPSGFKWSSKTGPDLDITSGTLASGSVVVRQDRPIDLVIPKLRETLGF